jgi:hypothetical protein
MRVLDAIPDNKKFIRIKGIARIGEVIVAEPMMSRRNGEIKICRTFSLL